MLEIQEFFFSFFSDFSVYRRNCIYIKKKKMFLGGGEGGLGRVLELMSSYIYIYVYSFFFKLLEPTLRLLFNPPPVFSLVHSIYFRWEMRFKKNPECSSLTCNTSHMLLTNLIYSIPDYDSTRYGRRRRVT